MGGYFTLGGLNLLNTDEVKVVDTFRGVQFFVPGIMRKLLYEEFLPESLTSNFIGQAPHNLSISYLGLILRNLFFLYPK